MGKIKKTARRLKNYKQIAGIMIFADITAIKSTIAIIFFTK